jgi:hypothetical protein
VWVDIGTVARVPLKFDTFQKKGKWQKICLFVIFLSFERDTENLRGTIVENVKKVKNRPTLVYNPSFGILQH